MKLNKIVYMYIFFFFLHSVLFLHLFIFRKETLIMNIDFITS